MSGWVYCHSACLACGEIFSYNPVHVPSSSAVTGEREPICRTCMARINEKRKGMGMSPFGIHPQAYEPLAEEELP
jgi:hypothetical protein